LNDISVYVFSLYQTQKHDIITSLLAPNYNEMISIRIRSGKPNTLPEHTSDTEHTSDIHTSENRAHFGYTSLCQGCDFLSNSVKFTKKP